jgi:hypothetical protein
MTEDEAPDDVQLDVEAVEPAPSSPVQRAKKRYGIAGGMLAGAMVAIRDILEPPKDDQVVTVEASSEPGDIDADGIVVPLDDDRQAVAPALPVRPYEPVKRRRHPRSRR